MLSRRTAGPWRIVVFADAGGKVGLGHLMRTRGLVEALRARRSVRVTYAGRFGKRERRWMRGWRYAVRSDRRGRGRESAGRLIRGVQPHIVIADAYRSLEKVLRAGRDAGACVVLFDDGQIRGKTPVSLRVAALGAPARGRPADRHLTGLRYICLRPEILKLRSEVPARQGSTCFVSLGGGRAGGRLGALVAALRATTSLRRWRIAGDLPSLSSPAPQRFREVRGGRALRLAASPREAARAMAGSSVAVSAAGTTAWELAFLGVPAVLWPMVENQRSIASELDGCTALVCRRWRDLPRALAGLLADRDRMRSMARRARRLVDGKGAGRIAAAVESWMRSSDPKSRKTSPIAAREPLRKGRSRSRTAHRRARPLSHD